MSDARRLNELVLELTRGGETGCAMLLEHLESARFYLSGAMPAEYRMSLAMAREELGCLGNDDTRVHARDFIEAELSEKQNASARRPEAGRSYS
jgi:hypothetical protein